jgi:predicted HAD superfamily Cof-like phosphohydrolase
VDQSPTTGVDSMSRDWVKDIFTMHNHYKVHPVIDNMEPETLKKFLEFRANFLQEELDELKKADNADDVVDALIDLCVVAIGTLDAFNIDAYKAWDEVLDANMKKNVGVKEGRPNPLGLPDLMKPEGWTAPSHFGNYGKLTKIF